MKEAQVIGKTDKRVMLNFYCPRIWREKLREAARERACPYSIIMRDMLEVFLKDRGKI